MVGNAVGVGGRSWEALPVSRDGSEGPPRGLGEIRRDRRGQESPQRARRIRSPSWRAGMVREDISEGWVGSLEMEVVGSSPRKAGRIGRSTQWARRGREALSES